MYPFHTASSFRKFASPPGLSRLGNSHLTDRRCVLSGSPLRLSLARASLSFSVYARACTCICVCVYLTSNFPPISLILTLSLLSSRLCVRFVPNYFIGYIIRYPVAFSLFSFSYGHNVRNSYCESHRTHKNITRYFGNER